MQWGKWEIKILTTYPHILQIVLHHIKVYEIILGIGTYSERHTIVKVIHILHVLNPLDPGIDIGACIKIDKPLVGKSVIA